MKTNVFSNRRRSRSNEELFTVPVSSTNNLRRKYSTFKSKRFSRRITDSDTKIIIQRSKNELDKRFSEKHRHFPKICSFVLFTKIVMVIGILTVYFTSAERTNKPCQMFFKRSAQRDNGYDSRPYHLTTGILNEDDYLDIVVANFGTDNIGIFLGYGNGTFASQILYSTGPESRPYSVAIGNFNNDALSDIVVTNYGINSIGVFLGHGNGSLQHQIITSIGSSRPLALTTGDFNNDHILDVAVVNSGTFFVIILLGYNNGSFYINKKYPMGFDSMPFSITAHDFNQDTKIDLAIVNLGTSELVVLLSNKNQDFDIYKYSTGYNSHPCAVAVGDFNRDRIIDIAVTNSHTSNIGIFLGYKNGTFSNQVTYPTGLHSRPRSLVVTHLSNNIYLDIIVVDTEYDNVIVMQGNENGSFSIFATHSTGYSSNPSALTVGNFDKNSNQSNIAVANNGTNSMLILSSFTINPTTNETVYSSRQTSRLYSVNVADFNNDSYPDILAPNFQNDAVDILMNLGNGTFENHATYYMGNKSSPLFSAIGDLNNDQYLDIVVILYDCNEIRILLGYGNGSFQLGQTYPSIDETEIYTAIVADLNQDNNLDIITANYYSFGIGIFFGYGDGTFTNMSLILTEIYYVVKCVDTGDFNNDTILDIVAVDSLGAGLAILLGYGNGSFQDPIITSINGGSPNCLTVADLNDDHRLDIIYTDKRFSYIVVLLGNGNGTFVTSGKYDTVRGSQPQNAALGYYNADNLLDIAVSNTFDSSISLYIGIGNGLFKPFDKISTGPNSSPWTVLFTDFDNDHQQDLVVANYNTNNILIFNVYYHAIFENETNYPTGSGSHPYSVYVSDLNSDNRSDVVVANAGNDNIEVLSMYRNGVFLNRTILLTGYGSHPQSVTIADFNNDHLSDVVVVNNWNDNMYVFTGRGNGSFDMPHIYSTGAESFPTFVTSGDFNNDNRMDIVVANEGTNNIDVFLAYKYITFTNDSIYVTGLLPTPYYIKIADFNNDNHQDLAVVNVFVHKIGIYLGYGNGSFSEQISFSTGFYSYPFYLSIGDFNNDSFQDIVVANSGTHTIGVFLGYGNGTFQPTIPYSTGYYATPESITTGDLNNDGVLDIIVANYDLNNIVIFLGIGNGSFLNYTICVLPNDSHPIWVAVTDLNNDKNLDIVVAATYIDSIGIFLGYGNGSFENLFLLSTGENSQPIPIAFGDFNNDDWFDIVVGNKRSKTIGIFFNYGNKTFSSQKIFPVSANADLGSIVVTDINNDTLLDILVADFDKLNSGIGIFYGLGNGAFTIPTIYPTGLNTYPSSIAIGDFNEDNQTDLAIACYIQDSLSIMLQLKSQPFAASVTFPTGNQSRPKAVAVADFDNDHRLDIAVANSGTNNIGILLGYGDQYFTIQLTYPTGNNSKPSSLSTGDFNNDSFIDIVVVNSGAENIGIFLGYGNGQFQNTRNYPTGIRSEPSSVTVSDLDKDNCLDLIVANYGTNNVLVFYGRGDGTFLRPQSYTVGYNADPQSVAIGDMNNDNLLDIVVTNYGSGYVEILLQTC